jgi:DNA (cytosine-5)-methyltransferase 1
MNELALFAGAGGGILGGQLLGWRTVCAVELNPYCRNVLLARQRDGHLPRFPIWDDVCTFDGRVWRGSVDVVSGGFPCQDISSAGKGAGIDGEQSSLWFQMARVVREVGPRFVFVENSPMLATRGLGRVLGNLAEMGFDAEWGVYSAADAGAPHLRKRMWILGYANGKGESDGPVDDRKTPRVREMAYTPGERRGQARNEHPCPAGRNGLEDRPPGRLAHSQPDGLEEPDEGKSALMPATRRWWEAEPRMGRLVNGLAHRVDRVKALGNGQVPAVVRLAWGELSARQK